MSRNSCARQGCRASKEHNRPVKIISILLSVAAVASTAAYFLYKLSSNRAYNEKWKDYDDCGVA